MTVVLDTHALLFWTHQPDRLSRAACAALDRLDAAHLGLVCSASLWEIALKHRSGRLALGMQPAEYLHRIERLPLQVVAIDAALWLDSVALDWQHRDPVDRLVVALSRRETAPVITADRAIGDWHGQVVW